MEKYPKLSVWTDGGARGNPGPAAIGVRITEGQMTLADLSESIGETTNNQAEYQALLLALRWLEKYAHEQETQLTSMQVNFYTDSELMAYQVQGRYRVKNAELRPLYEEAMRQLQAFATYTITPIRREKNQVADGLVNKALDALALSK